MKAASALTVQTEVLGERLGNEQFKALLDEVADGPSIAVKVTRSEALVGGVEEGEVLLGPDDFGNFTPLGVRRVNTSRVVGAGVQQDDAPLGCIADGLLHTLDVEALCLLVKVRVLCDGNANIGEDLVVVGPCWVGQENGLVALVEFGEEQSTQVDGTGARDGLNGGYALLGNGRRRFAQNKLGGFGGERGETCDGQVFVVEVGIVADNLVGLEGCRRLAGGLILGAQGLGRLFLGNGGVRGRERGAPTLRDAT